MRAASLERHASASGFASALLSCNPSSAVAIANPAARAAVFSVSILMAPKLASPSLVPGSAPGLGTSSALLFLLPFFGRQRTALPPISGAQLPLVKQIIEI